MIDIVCLGEMLIDKFPNTFTTMLLVQLVTEQKSWRAQLEPARLQAIVRRANVAGAFTTLQQGVFQHCPL